MTRTLQWLLVSGLLIGAALATGNQWWCLGAFVSGAVAIWFLDRDLK